jgi:DNA repair exonuclease SbcCD ATPase subunit
MKIKRLSGRERGEENLAKVRSYLAALKAARQPLPLENGRPNITAIAEASGVLRNVFYTNAGVKRLLAELAGGFGGTTEPTAALSHAERQLEIKDRRIHQLEQQLASARAEIEDLRKRLAAAAQTLARYKLIEEEVLKAGRRVIL